MTTLTITKECVTHTPHIDSISVDYKSMDRYTFCEECEQNIESFYIDSDGDRLGSWSKWKVSN